MQDANRKDSNEDLNGQNAILLRRDSIQSETPRNIKIVNKYDFSGCFSDIFLLCWNNRLILGLQFWQHTQPLTYFDD